MTDFHYYEPARGHRLAHDPLNSIIAPRPIGWISSCDGDGCCNLAPYSFFNAFNYQPPVIGFASIGYKDSVRNIAQTREFVWNLATQTLGEAMNETCAPFAHGVDEFERAGLDKAPSRLVRAPRVAASPVSFECRLTQILQLRDQHDAPLQTWLVLGEVVAVHIDKAMLVDGVYDTVLAEPLLRGGGPADYFSVSDAQRSYMWRPGA
ncbi:flavin reductase family protein [Solimonas marina]|uniref:Flavin reductase family protein n=1 Tax=Solimonas marina TaxID=2714601 RepID=A0A969W7K8_9GAMM|nr:flavin reductase family protein [Solimonas marina]NKF20958.1 flavin reductase family protein [Solimonas marina]